MSWIKESENKSWIQQWCTKVLKCGPVPKHVAIIMDGNRRFAKKKNFERAKGHLLGFDKLAETLEWCLDLGITEVTVYAFSIENFKRSKDEVDCLLELARNKFERIMQEKELLEKHGVCVRVLGNMSLMPRDIQEMIAEAVILTQKNDRAFLNIAFAYTSRDEICTAMREIAEGVNLGLIKESDISKNLIEQCFYTNNSPDPDLLVRTSGEVRLSDFLLWQSSFSVLSFMRVLWPEFSVWHLYAAILHYQRNYSSIQAARESHSKEKEEEELQSDYQCVYTEHEKKQNGTVQGESYLQEKVRQYTLQRKQRIHRFLENVKNKRNTYLAEMYPSNGRINPGLMNS